MFPDCLLKPRGPERSSAQGQLLRGRLFPPKRVRGSNPQSAEPCRFLPFDQRIDVALVKVDQASKKRDLVIRSGQFGLARFDHSIALSKCQRGFAIISGVPVESRETRLSFPETDGSFVR